MNRPWAADDTRKIADYSCALTAAAALQRTPRAVQDKARRHGLPVPKMPHASYWPDSILRRCIGLREAGHSLSRISNATGVPFGTIKHWIYR